MQPDVQGSVVLLGSRAKSYIGNLAGAGQFTGFESGCRKECPNSTKPRRSSSCKTSWREQSRNAGVEASAQPPEPSVLDPAISDPQDPKTEPFAFVDFTWLNGNARTKDAPYATKFFTPEIRADINYTYDFRHPQVSREAIVRLW